MGHWMAFLNSEARRLIILEVIWEKIEVDEDMIMIMMMFIGYNEGLLFGTGWECEFWSKNWRRKLPLS